MASKEYDLVGIGQITITKRRGNRNIRLSFTSNGSIRISLPYYAPYRAGLNFARSKQSWIIDHRPASPRLLASGQIIAKKYQLEFAASPLAKKPSGRLVNDKIVINYPKSLELTSEPVQLAARRSAIRTIRKEAGLVLPPLLDKLAKTHGYKYSSVVVKPLKTRWGSCDQTGNIKLNIYLIELAPELIEYVLLHELAHTKFQHHQAEFWQEMRRHLADVDNLKKRARSTRPGITTS